MRNRTASVVIYVIIVLLLALAVGFAVKLTDGFTSTPKTYAEVDGERVNAETIIDGGKAVTISVRSPFGVKVSFTAKVLANTDDEHNFEYTAGGSAYDYAGTDLTAAAGCDTSSGDLVIAPIHLESALAALHDVSEVEGLANLDLSFPWVKVVITPKDAEDITLLLRVTRGKAGIGSIELDKTEVIL